MQLSQLLEKPGAPGQHVYTHDTAVARALFLADKSTLCRAPHQAYHGVMTLL